MTARRPLLVGSIKTVVGHLEGCAGLAGVIKVLLAMKHSTIPPNLHLTSLNPKIAALRHVLRVPTEPTAWPAPAAGQPKRASVNSFGFGGTNAHVILESYGDDDNDVDNRKEIKKPLPEAELVAASPLVVSGHSQTSLLENVRKLARYLRDHPKVKLEDVAWTLWTRRSAFTFRKSFTAASRQELLRSLEETVGDSATDTHQPQQQDNQPTIGTSVSSLVSPSEGFGVLGVFTGQGAQWPGMGKELMEKSRVFRETIDECDRSLSALPDAPSWSLRDELLKSLVSASRIAEAEIAQPATTAVEMGLARMLEASGVRFSAVVGHSSGEIAALFAAGILSMSDAIRIAFYRGLYASRLAGVGSMMAVGVGVDAAEEFCREESFRGRICLAAKNSPSSVTLSGDVDAVLEAKAALDERGVFARVLRTDKAYHSPHMEACSEAYLAAMRACGISPLGAGKCVWVSSVDGNADRYWDRRLDDLGGPYWIENMVRPVLFADAITAALTNGGPFDVAVEVGPHPALKGPVNQTVRPHLGRQIPYCASMKRGENCATVFSELFGFLWSNFGAEEAALDYDGYRACWRDDDRADDGIPAPKVVQDLPSYSWDHAAHIWRESRLSRNHRLRSGGNGSLLLGHRCPDDSDWEPRWRNFLSLKELPWLRGHSFQGEVLFPSAGYVAMMLEVARFVAGDRPVALVEIDGLTLERPLKLEDSPRPVEMITSVKVRDAAGGQGGGERKLTAEFSVYVCPDAATGAVDRTCFGTLSVCFGESPDGLPLQPLPPRVDPLPASVSPVDVERFYCSVRETGLEYQDLFKRVESMRRVDGIATATASWAAEEMEHGGLYHPALIDVALQPVFAAFNAPTAERLWTAYLPQSFNKITVNPQRLLTPSSTSGRVDVLIDAFTTEASATKISGDVSIYSPDDGFTRPWLQLEGMTLAALGRPSAANDRILFAETRWEADLLGGSDFGIDYDPPQDAAVEEAERVALFFCRKLLASAAELLRTVGDEAGSVFRNEKQMVHVLFADDKLSRFYREGLGLRNAQRQVSAYMRALSHRYPKARILELGAGTGATTSAVFEAVGSRFGSYTFTDVSLAFFPEAQKRFAEHAHKMTYKKLDIGLPFAEQGFDAPAYDIVIAANVLHVSDDIGAVLGRVRGLLRPGGFLVATEPSSDHLRIQVIMGGLEGWWLARDTECRRFGPVAAVETWDEKLRGAGFGGIDLLSGDQRDEELSTFSSFVSQATDGTVDAIREPLLHMHMVPASTRFVVVGGSSFATSKMVRSIRNRLSGQGEGEVVYFPDVRSIGALSSSSSSSLSPGLPQQCFVLCLAELDRPSLSMNGVDEDTLAGFKALVDHAEGMLLVTRNAGVSNPFSNMMVGLCRGLRAEKPALSRRLQVLDLEGESKPDTDTLLQHFLRLVLCAACGVGEEDGSDGGYSSLLSLETELSLRNNQLFIPRVEECREPNDRANSTRRRIVRDVTTETHVVEIVHQQKEVAGLGAGLVASSKVVSEKGDGTETIEINFSTLAPLTILPYQPPQYLCLGTRRTQTEKTEKLGGSSTVALVLSPSNSSVVQVPDTQVYMPAGGETLRPEMLGLVALTLSARAWIRSVPRDHVLWAHGLDETVVRVLEREAEEHGVRVFATSTDPARPGFIHPASPARVLKSVIPARTTAIIVGDSVGDAESDVLLSRVSPPFVLQQKPCTGRFLHPPPTAWSGGDIPVSRLLHEAYASTVPEWPGTPPPPPLVCLEDLNSTSSFPNPMPVVDWRGARTTPVEARLQPVPPSQLFRPDRTYLMVGLTRDVGISICTWMIRDGGVRHVVLASRDPHVSPAWIESMSRVWGATVVVRAMDVTRPERIREVVDEVARAMPPIAGVCNGSMVLSDGLFAQTDAASVNAVLGPKVNGSIHLDRIFSDRGDDLDFFVMLSSTGSVIGTPGQSNYHMANTFMAGLAADRRRRGLAGSVVDVGMISDTGYVTRQDPIVAKKLRSMCVLALCEAEVHVMFAEGILATFFHFCFFLLFLFLFLILILILTFILLFFFLHFFFPLSRDNDAERPFWAPEPRFGFYVRDKRDAAAAETSAGGSSSSLVEDVQAVIRAASSGDEEAVLDKVRQAFAQRLETPARGRAKMDLPLVSLGLDSLLAMEVQAWFRRVVGADISVLQILSGATGESICRAASMSALAAKAKNSSDNSPRNETAPGPVSEPDVKKAAHLDNTDGSSSAAPDTIPTPPSSSSLSSSSYPAGTPESESSAALPTPLTLSDSGNNKDGSKEDGYFKERKASELILRRARMSFAQARLWFLQGFLDDPTTYNETSMYELRGPLDADRLRRAFHQVTRHHEILRTRFYTDAETGQPMQAVAATSSCPFRFVDKASQETADQEYAALTGRRWNLEEGVCLGLSLLRHAPDRHTLILSSHHIAIDGVTWIVLLKDLARSYEGQTLPAVPQYIDFAVRQRERVERGDCAEAVGFWRRELAGLLEDAPLPLFPMAHTKTRRATSRYATTVVEAVLPKDLVSRIRQLSSSVLHVTPFHFHFAVLSALVARLSRSNDFCIGAVDTGRPSGSEFSGTAGCFVNIVPVRVRIHPDDDGIDASKDTDSDTFASLCKRLSSRILSSLAHAATMPLDALLDELQVPRTARHSPVFQVIINYRLGILGLSSVGDAELTYVRSRSSGNPYDLGVSITDTPDGTSLLHFAVQDALYSKEAARSILECYVRLLESACQTPQSAVAELSIHGSKPGVVSAASSSSSALTGRGLRVQDEWPSTVSRQIDSITEVYPDRVALRDGSRSYTYREVAAETDRIAAVLLEATAVSKAASTSPPVFCCLLFEPSADYVFALLAVLKVGLVAVSLDTTNHAERLGSIVADCKPMVILHHGATKDLAVRLGEPHEGISTLITLSSSSSSSSSSPMGNRSLPDTPGVLFYTSGTTGVPKGALLTQGNYKHIIAAASRRLGIRPATQEVVLQQTSVGFDLCPFEIFMALSNAGTLVVASKEQRQEPSAVVGLIKSEGVTFMSGTPAEFKHIFRHDALGTLRTCGGFRTVVVGGEVFTPQLAGQFKRSMSSNVKVFNVYGPTETCIFCSVEEVPYSRGDDDDLEEPIPVGRTLDNVSVYVVDEAMNLLPDGCAGEVCIGGAGVSRGYFGLSSGFGSGTRNSSAFVPDPRLSGWTGMYRTGDSGYLKPDGSLVVLGRIGGSTQVKIRGIRIELDDVASNILRTAGGKLAEAVVTVRGGEDDKTLVAFAVVAPGSADDEEDVDEFLESLPARLPLPEYMRPSVVVALDGLPMNHNGKLDRSALDRIPIPARTTTRASKQGEGLSALERELGLVWEAVLPDIIIRNGAAAAGTIHPDSDFFRLGGNSLLLVNLRKTIQKRWRCSVPLIQLFEASTLRSMAAAIRGAKESQSGGVDWEFWDRESSFDMDADASSSSSSSSHFNSITQTAPKGRREDSSAVVLLTGAHVGLGAWLLRLLLEDASVAEVHCIAASLALPSDKLHVYVGSLGERDLGLTAAQREHLETRADIVVHAGAEGSCLNNYDSIRTQNVESTRFLARLALARKIPFHYISSPRVVLFSGETSYPERPVSSHYPPAALGREGFTTTKWVCERFLENCSAATGLPVTIHRTGYLMSDDADELDAVNMIHKYSVLVGAVPSLDTFSGFLDMCQLPTAAAAVVGSFRETTESGVSYQQLRIVHHTEGNVVPVHEFRSYMERRFGRPFASLPMVDWAAKAEEKNMSPVLAAFLEAVVDRGEEARYPRLLRGDGSEPLAST
ncbi:hybrid pks-nrps [Colletotrichum higginsianum]|nr:hybrid pks-nrps [Colletotrichum higginsianum]